MLRPQTLCWFLRYRCQSAPSPISSTASFSTYQPHRHEHKQQIRYQRRKNSNKTSGARCWPTWKRPRSAGERRELWKPAAGTRAKVSSPAGWRPSSLEEQVFYRRRRNPPPTPHPHHRPPQTTPPSPPCSEDDRCSIPSLHQVEGIGHPSN